MTTSGTIPRRPNTGAPKFQADPINSTFRWELYLTAGLKGNSVPLMDGYSKGMGFENTNKLELLYKKLVNPILPYISRCDLIVVFEQDRRVLKHLHPKLVELYPRNFKVHGWLKETTVITDFLENYYTNYIHTGTLPPLEDRRKNVRQTVYFKELDHTKYNFQNIEELKDFCNSHVSKFSYECMRGWYFRHADFQPELFGSDIAVALQQTVNESTTYEGAQAAQEGLQGVQALYGKHTTNRK